MTKFAPIFGLLILLGAVSYFTKIQQPNIDLNQALVEDVRIQIHVSPFPVMTETDTQIIVRLNAKNNESIKAINGRIEGVNMSMGRIPVVWQQATEANLYRGSFMLGSCSEANMRWQLFINLTLESGEEIQRIAEFSSQRQ